MTAFLLDGMLEGLARRLRLLGYDCRMIGEDVRGERAILALAREEDRLVLTLSARRAAYAPERFLLLPEEDVGKQIAFIITRYPTDFRHWAFTRCSRDNTPLIEVSFPSVADRLPPRVRELAPSPIRHCPVCDRLYWPGTHTRRVREAFRQSGIDLG